MLARRYREEAPAAVLAPFAHRGLVRARMWLERPSAHRAGRAANRDTYNESHLFYGIVRRLGPRAARRVEGRR